MDAELADLVSIAWQGGPHLSGDLRVLRPREEVFCCLWCRNRAIRPGD